MKAEIPLLCSNRPNGASKLTFLFLIHRLEANPWNADGINLLFPDYGENVSEPNKLAISATENLPYPLRMEPRILRLSLVSHPCWRLLVELLLA